MKAQTKTQISAGGIAYKRNGQEVEVALISVGTQRRWQLPKGLVDEGENTEEAARREVREEAGIETEIVQFIEKIEYWYYGTEQGARVRYHKFVHFYLLRFVSGDVRQHDHEVHEARWFPLNEAHQVLAFDGERKILIQAQAMLAEKS